MGRPTPKPTTHGVWKGLEKFKEGVGEEGKKGRRARVGAKGKQGRKGLKKLGNRGGIYSQIQDSSAKALAGCLCIGHGQPTGKARMLVM